MATTINMKRRLLLSVWTLCSLVLKFSGANPDAKRLYDDLLTRGRYNKLVRPVEKNADQVNVHMGLKLSQLLYVDTKNQIIAMNMWLTQQWIDKGLGWKPHEYGGVDILNIPAEEIWLPDVVLYNNGDGDYNVTELTTATVEYTGQVTWDPPVIVKSYCNINVKYFPFDQQTCLLKFGTWSYAHEHIDIHHIWADRYPGGEIIVFNESDRIRKIVPPKITIGIDTAEYYEHVEWDLMSVPAQKHIEKYTCCEEGFPDITFYLTFRRKTRHYTVNLIIPCLSLNMLTVLGFYLPSDCGEKISLCISILLSLSIFQLLLMDLMPPTSFTLPLLGKYLLLTLLLITISISSSVMVLNVNFRTQSAHKMPTFIRKIFLGILPPLLLLRRPIIEEDPDEKRTVDWAAGGQHSDLANYGNPYRKKLRPILSESSSMDSVTFSSTFIGMNFGDMNAGHFCEACARERMKKFPPSAQKAFDAVSFIAKHHQDDDVGRKVKEDWKFLAMVIDRILLWTYTSICLVGGMSIMLNAPVLYDTAEPLPLGTMPPPRIPVTTTTTSVP